MKKQNLKSLKLNKQIITLIESSNVNGGANGNANGQQPVKYPLPLTKVVRVCL